MKHLTQKDIKTLTKRRIAIYIGMFLLLLISIAFILTQERGDFHFSLLQDLVFLLEAFAAFITIVATINSVVRFIEGDKRPSESSDKSNGPQGQNDLEKQLLDIKQTLNDIQASTGKEDINDAETVAILEKLDLLLTKEATEEQKETDSSKVKLTFVQSQINELKDGVNYYLGRISRYGTVNLVIGMVTSTIAILVLLWLVVYSNVKDYKDTTQYFVSIIPRISLALFIETFSFFFLRLYKSNLEDVKYFHNERTNIDSKIIALKLALIHDDQDILEKVIENYYNVERNFVLKKGESTIDLERAKVDSKIDSEILSKLKISELVEKIKK